ncbi:hypothetical protein HNP52_002191 [Sphingomonas kyeonggiensis]|uniref:Uncharacterized protein n=1 Tax=Sphingomonas kyeonggiensis TaxID=1268553 RepID=A0A7W7K153_9SPHN|nr:hypothetical protein [Sphingomonas kyeonggiensis]MBB4839122.1 hypothetical protein [Sphingomonas kyeonggiensis]
MSEIEEELVEAGDGETLLYDYFKHLTSLCIVSLGGVLALVSGGKNLPPNAVIAVLLVLALAGLLSFSGAGEIVRARFQRRPVHKSLNLCRIAAPVLLSVGVGMFVYLFTRTLQP